MKLSFTREVRAQDEKQVLKVTKTYRTTVILRDLEEMSYEEIAEITDVSLGTVKSRLTRGREALRKRLTGYVVENAQQLGLQTPGEEGKKRPSGCRISAIEVSR
jgi:RNA polymerase sigma-70 factor (ECF subfamily)